jgi:uncharacterized membrane protein YgcG
MRIVHLVAAFFALIATPALAKEVSSAWVVAQKSGDVRVIQNGLQPASVQVRAALSPGDVIATGANGRAMLTRGDDYVVVAPGSRLLLPKAEEKRGFTRLIQQVGTMLYKVKHTGVPHFAVQTPMLAAVVKGTSFSVVVDDQRAAVQVTEGVVEVSSLSGDARRLVERGITVYIGRERPNEIIEMKPGVTVPPATSGAKAEAVKIERSGDVPLSTIATLTDGLVKEAPVVVAANTATNVLAPTSPSALPTGLQTTVTPVTTPAVDLVDSTVPAVVEPVTDIVDATAPGVVDGVTDIVETTVPGVVDPVVDIVETTVPTVVEPVVDIVETTVPTVLEPVVEIVETTVPTVVEPVVEIVGAVTQPVVDVVETVTQPVTDVVGGLLGGLFGGGSSGSGGGGNSGPGGGGGPGPG